MKSKLQLSRVIFQFIFLALWALAIYAEVSLIYIILLIASFIFGNFFCGWVCPFGSAQDLFSRIGSFLIKKKFKMPRAIQKYLKYTRYLILIIVAVNIAPQLIHDNNSYKEFMVVIYDIYDNYFSLTFPFALLACYLIIAMFFDRPFCNYFCTEGTKPGIANLTRIFTIKRNAEKCIDCKLCDKKCPMNIEVSAVNTVRDIQCINCLECISACPKKETLKYTYTGWKANKPWHKNI